MVEQEKKEMLSQGIGSQNAEVFVEEKSVICRISL